ncbi:hypothetical protein QFC22_000771 [Naganishia vaughanmartiniae]|uniref:Uncharacterized protein n=1 Tax=Naganishia vaughanmartiniae TaxID=1424756 RepID=A0ACC2XK40_9TREE|nr:hypothetical protein QFC22_000771 [Naganishia vaughanmartiniae]
MSAVKRYSTSTHLGSIFYYDGLTRNPHRWLASGPPQASQSLCLYSLKVPIGKHDVGNTAAELVVNFLRSETEEEAWAVTKLQERLFPGCLIHIPVAQWFRTYESGSASRSPDEPPYRSVMDDYLRREKAMKSVLFGALHLR